MSNEKELKVNEEGLREYLDRHAAGQEYLLAGMREMFTKNGRILKGAEPKPVGTNASATAMLANSSCRVVGFALKETTGLATAELDLLDGVNADGDMLIPVTLAPGESVRDWFGPAGVSFVRGVFAQLVSGSVSGSVWIGRIDV